jgi:hypothetical protein
VATVVADHEVSRAATGVRVTVVDQDPMGAA